MTLTTVALFVVDLGFAIAERIDAWSTKRKKRKVEPIGFSWKDVLEIKRQSDTAVRRSEAPTVVIPPPSELLRNRASAPPPRKPSIKR